MTTARKDFIDAQQRMLDRYGVEADSRFFEVRSLGGQVHALVSGEGPDVVMLNGIGTPAAMWAPLMAELDGFRLLAVDLPAFGLTDATEDFVHDLRHNAVSFLDEVLEGLGLEAALLVASWLTCCWQPSGYRDFGIPCSPRSTPCSGCAAIGQR